MAVSFRTLMKNMNLQIHNNPSSGERESHAQTQGSHAHGTEHKQQLQRKQVMCKDLYIRIAELAIRGEDSGKMASKS